MNNNIPSVNSLHKEKNIKKSNVYNIYNIVLEKCIEQIKYTNKYTDKTYIIFTVPSILIGYTNYNINSCLQYIMNTMIQHNYIVRYIEPRNLYIDWGNNSSKSHATELLTYFPNLENIEYVYEDDEK